MGEMGCESSFCPHPVYQKSQRGVNNSIVKTVICPMNF